MEWQKAKIIKTTQASADMKSIIVEPITYYKFRAGQHYELRLPENDISRKYSIVSGINTEKNYIEFGIQLISNGVLSPKLWNLKEEDEIEIRGPLGESFVWDPSISGPIILIGAGSGITPLLSIYNSYTKEYPQGKCIFIMSAKDSSRIMNYSSLKDILITRFSTIEGRINLEFLKKNIGELAQDKKTVCYICGPDNFIDDMVDNVLELGVPEDNVKSERFI
jgi:ferredoxin-NADP reductase